MAVAVGVRVAVSMIHFGVLCFYKHVLLGHVV